MPFHRQAETAEFAQDRGSLLAGREHARTRIVVHVMHVAAEAVGPAAGTVNKPRAVMLLRPFENLVRLELSPTFVERHPGDDARKLAGEVHDLLPLLAIVR